VPNRLVSLEALERTRAQQAGEAKAVSAHTGARSRLGGALEKPAGVLAPHDQVAETAKTLATAEAVVVSPFGPSGRNRGGRGGKRSATDPAGRASEHR
jgi:hypothetical protein